MTEDFLNKLAGAKGPSMANIPDLEWDSEFIQSVGALPCPYHRYYYMKEEMYREISEYHQETGKTRADDVKKSKPSCSRSTSSLKSTASRRN